LRETGERGRKSVCVWCVYVCVCVCEREREREILNFLIEDEKIDPSVKCRVTGKIFPSNKKS
jgi:hypothetical protein